MFKKVLLSTFALILVLPNTFNVAPPIKADTFNKRILTIGINPEENGETVVEKFWGDHTDIENRTFNGAIDAFQRLSNGLINYTIVDHINISVFPLLPNGQPSFTMATYSKCTGGGTAEDIQNCDNSKWAFSYTKFFDDNNICQIANQENIDEIWLITPPYIGKWESLHVGPYEGFWINGGSEVNTNCNKLYSIMGPTYDRPENLLHNFGHRIESTLEYLFSNINIDETNLNWRRFSGFGGQPLGCGNTHFPKNNRFSYDYGNPDSATSICPDWKNFPDYNGATATVGCNTWGCNDPGWEEYWFSFIPSSSGQAIMHNSNNQALFMQKNWWIYLLNTSEAENFVAYSANPGQVDTSCTNITYSDWGACSNGEHTRSITSTQPSGCTPTGALTTQECAICYKYTYSDWNTCQNGKQQRTVSEQTEVNCPGDSMAPLEQNCSVSQQEPPPQNNDGSTPTPTPVAVPTPTTPDSFAQNPGGVLSYPIVNFINTLIPGLITAPENPTSYSEAYSINPQYQNLITLMGVLGAVGGILLATIVIGFLYPGFGLKRFKKVV